MGNTRRWSTYLKSQNSSMTSPSCTSPEKYQEKNLITVKKIHVIGTYYCHIDIVNLNKRTASLRCSYNGPSKAIQEYHNNHNLLN